MRDDIDIEKMSDAELRQLCEDAWEKFDPIEKMIAAAPDGTFACPNCCATASWERKGAAWTAQCLLCDWDAAGDLGEKYEIHQ